MYGLCGNRDAETSTLNHSDVAGGVRWRGTLGQNGRCRVPIATSGVRELADDGVHGLSRAGELLGPQRHAADDGVPAPAVARAQLADVVAARLVGPRVDADRQLDALGGADPRDRVEAVGVEQVAQEARAARAGLAEPVEH